jgi:hypothetical protein
VEDVEERLACLEGRAEEPGHMVSMIRDGITALEGRIASLEARMDQGFEQIDQRFAVVDRRFLGIDHRLDSLDTKVGRLFGVMVAVLVAIIGGMGRIIAAILKA